MTCSLEVPEEAVERVVPLLTHVMTQGDAEDLAWDVVRAAAPLIVATELDRMAAAIDRSLWPDPMGQFSTEQAHAARVMKQDALKVLRSRASVLRGEGDPK